MRDSNGNCWRHCFNCRSTPTYRPVDEASTRAVIGLGAGTVRVHPFASIALVLALERGSVAMVFGVIYQASVSGLAP